MKAENLFVVLKWEDLRNGLCETMRDALNEILADVRDYRNAQGKVPVPQYIVCNRDEPYASRVLQEILDGETDKEVGVSRLGSRWTKEWNVKAQEVHRTAMDKGWWDHERNDGETIALMHAGLSEALSALLAGNPQDKALSEFTLAETRLAGVIIRILDYAAGRELRIGQAIEVKAKPDNACEYAQVGNRL